MFIETGLACGPARTLVYGGEGLGKSTFFAMAENPVFIQTEDGTGRINCARFKHRQNDPLCRSYDEVVAAIAWLHAESHDRQTVVIDSLDWLEKLIHEAVCRRHGKTSFAEWKWQEGFDFALAYWHEILDGLSALRNDRGMAVGLIAHEKIENFKDPLAESYHVYWPGIHKKADHIVRQWCDEVFFATKKVITTKADEGFGRKRVLGKGDDERVIYTTERPAFKAKNRLNLPHEIPLWYPSYVEHRDAFLKAGEDALYREAG